jgi:hypothetical protein
LNPSIDISVNVTAEWDGPNGTIFDQIMTEKMSPNNTIIAKLNANAARNDDYTCHATVNPDPESEFINSSTSMTGSATITVGKCYSSLQCYFVWRACLQIACMAW